MRNLDLKEMKERNLLDEIPGMENFFVPGRLYQNVHYLAAIDLFLGYEEKGSGSGRYDAWFYCCSTKENRYYTGYISYNIGTVDRIKEVWKACY